MTTYAHIVKGLLDATGDLPASAVDITTGETVTPQNGTWTTELAASCGWFPIVSSAPAITLPKPPDSDTQEFDAIVLLINGQPTPMWVARKRSPEEVILAAAARELRAQRALNRAEVKAILDTIDSTLTEARNAKAAAQSVLDSLAPTNVNQAWDRIKDLARAVKDTDNALIATLQATKSLAKFTKDSQ